VTLENSVTHRTKLRFGESVVATQDPEQLDPKLFPVFAYGCRRGSALGGASRQVNLSDDDGPEIATLFDDGADLIQAETWLISLDGDRERNPRSSALLEAIFASLANLLDVSNVYVRDQKLWVTEKTGIQ